MLISSETVDSVKKFGKTALKTKNMKNVLLGLFNESFNFSQAFILCTWFSRTVTKTSDYCRRPIYVQIDNIPLYMVP